MRPLLFTVSVLLALSGCNGVSPIVIQPPGGGESGGGSRGTTTLTLDFGTITALRDCDAVGGGDFRFRVTATSNSESSASGTVYSRSIELGRGDRTSGLGLRQFDLPARNGQTVTVRFAATEMDDPVIGGPKPDDRMDNLSQTVTHVFNNGQWSNTGSKRIDLGGGVCHVRLDYSAIPS